MAGGSEYGKCEMCETVRPLSRKYFYYPIVCDCCGGASAGRHVEVVRHCANCVPQPPRWISVSMAPMNPTVGDQLDV